MESNSNLLVFIKDRKGQCRYRLDSSERSCGDTRHEAVVIPKLAPAAPVMQYDEWRWTYSQYVDHIYEYIMHYLPLFDTNLVVTCKHPDVLVKESLSQYLYSTSANASKRYKFFK